VPQPKRSLSRTCALEDIKMTLCAVDIHSINFHEFLSSLVLTVSHRKAFNHLYLPREIWEITCFSIGMRNIIAK